LQASERGIKQGMPGMGLMRLGGYVARPGGTLATHLDFNLFRSAVATCST